MRLSNHFLTISRAMLRPALLILVSPILVLGLIPAIGSVIEWFSGVATLPTYQGIFLAIQESPRRIASLLSALYLQLVIMFAFVVIPFSIGRAAFWKPFNRWADNKMEQALYPLPESIRPALRRTIGIVILCTLAWLIATAFI